MEPPSFETYAGLSRVLSDWSGTGELYKAIAAASDVSIDRSWAPQEIERRAMRIVLLECAPLLSRWPKSRREWDRFLPALTVRRRSWSSSPSGRVDWAKTRRRGWPPQSFAVRQRSRSSDQLALSVLAWTIERLSTMLREADSLPSSQIQDFAQIPSDLRATAMAASPLLAELAATDGTPPSYDDLTALRGEGWPWNAVADVGEVFRRLDREGALAIARRLIGPTGFPEVLFQLGIVGEVILACERAGANIESLRPIGLMTDGPIYRIAFPTQPAWDLWCEAGRCWEIYEVEDHLKDLAGNLRFNDGARYRSRHIRPDVLLARKGGQALVLECKFPTESWNPGYVARGVYQAHFYGQQLSPAFSSVICLAVGPDELVENDSRAIVGGITTGIASTRSIAHVVSALVLPT